VTFKVYGDVDPTELAEVAVEGAGLGPGVYDCTVIEAVT
jgi:hypothetical protein